MIAGNRRKDEGQSSKRVAQDSSTDQVVPCVEVASQSPISEPGNSTKVASAVPHVSPTPCKTLSLSLKEYTSNKRILEDRHHLLTTFPAEVWLIIIDYLDNDDLLALSNSSPFLREVLLPRRVDFLFKPVWEAMGKMYEKTLLKSKNARELLKLRLVCRSWNKVLENYYQQHPLHFELGDEIDATSFHILKLLRVNMSNRNVRGLTSLDQDSSYLASAGNPFFARSVRVQVNTGDTRSLWDTTLSVLDSYGHQIWYCSIVFDCSVPQANPQGHLTTAILYSIIRSVLDRVPNLKVLHVLANNVNSRFNRLEELISSNPIPRLEHLQMLTMGDLPALIFNELLRQNSHVSTLEIIRDKVHVNYDIYNTPLSNLKTFSTILYSQQEFLELTNTQVDWSLTKLHLNLYFDCFIDDWLTIFKVVYDKFKKFLTHLRMYNPIASPTIHNLMSKLHLPNLTHLHLHMSNLSCLDFLLPMRDSLVDLTLFIKITGLKKEKVLTMAEQVEDGNVIKLLSCARNKDLKSNIWEVLSKLSQLRFWLRVEKEVLLKLHGTRQKLYRSG